VKAHQLSRCEDKRSADSITYPQYENGVRLDGTRLIISKIGAVHVVLHRPLEGTPKTVTLSRSRSGKWYACFSVETEPTTLPESSAAIGVDMDRDENAAINILALGLQGEGETP